MAAEVGAKACMEEPLQEVEGQVAQPEERRVQKQEWWVAFLGL